MNESEKKKIDPKMVELYHDLGWMPDRFYYQLNGKSAQENYADFKNKRFLEWKQELLNRANGSDDDDMDVHITSEVKIK